MKALLRFFLRACFGFRVHRAAVLRTPGPVLLVPNHVSWLDWLLLYAVLDDDWKFVASSTTAEKSWFHRRTMRNRRTFPVDTASPYAMRDIAGFLATGGRLVLFAEGRISLTGGLMKLFDGTGFLIRKTGAKIVPCYLRGANRLRFVRHPGWKKWFPRVSVHFGDALQPPACAHLSHTAARQKLTTWLRDEMVKQQFEVESRHGPQNVLAAVAETAANIPQRIALEDIALAPLNYRRLITGTDAFAGAWRRLLSADGTSRIGVLLPNVNALPITLLSLWATGCVPALLNFSSGLPTMLGCARLAGLREIVTSRAFLEKTKLDPAPFAAAGLRLIFIEDVRAAISRPASLAALIRHRLAPGARFRRSPLRGHDTAVILFTSGSEGVPKGVELTHGNLLANLRQVSAVIDLADDDRFFSTLPLFHSFGLTAGVLFPLVRGCYTFLYPSPLHYRVVPTLVYDRRCTVLMGTNTFLNGYAHKAHPYDFTSLRYLVAGAEKVQAATFDTWARRFGVRILEGYGATECSPVLSLNTRMEPGVGTAGRLLPGIASRLEPVEGVTDGGRLLVRGPNVMKGYLNSDANTRFRALDGWYDTGDIVRIDADGFLHILGRVKRFAKISGEMVSLTAVENALAGAFPQHGLRCQVAVTNEPRLQLADLRAALRAKGLGNLCVPRELVVVGSIPKLGTGKTDHRALERQLQSTPAPEPPVPSIAPSVLSL